MSQDTVLSLSRRNGSLCSKSRCKGTVASRSLRLREILESQKPREIHMSLDPCARVVEDASELDSLLVPAYQLNVHRSTSFLLAEVTRHQKQLMAVHVDFGWIPVGN